MPRAHGAPEALWFVRAVPNKLPMALGLGGWVTLAVTDRRSRPADDRSVPVALA